MENYRVGQIWSFRGHGYRVSKLGTLGGEDMVYFRSVKNYAIEGEYGVGRKWLDEMTKTLIEDVPGAK